MYSLLQFSLVMRRRVPRYIDIQNTLAALLRSSAFLTTNAYAFPAFACIVRKLLGSFNVFTAAFVPCLFTSYCAISIERPSRRPLLALYVANVGSETLWRMMEHRKLVKSTRTGQILLFGVSTAILACIFHKKIHLQLPKESLFNVIKYVIGDVQLEHLLEMPPLGQQPPLPGPKYFVRYGVIAWCVKFCALSVHKLKNMSKGVCCPHRNSCLYYCLSGGIKLFGTGLLIQVGLKALFQLKRILKKPRLLFVKENINLAIFLGGFTTIFRTVSCLLRRTFRKDSTVNCAVATLCASPALTFYPDNSIVLYIMWKTLQILFQIGVSRGYWKTVPQFTEIFYSFWTSILFHGALVEPNTIRNSYWRFLIGLSGGRIAVMDRKPLDAFGLESSRQLEEKLEKTGGKKNYNYRYG